MVCPASPFTDGGHNWTNGNCECGQPSPFVGRLAGAVKVVDHGTTPYIRRSPDEIKAKISFLKARRGLMLDYLSLKLDEDDMHGVQDAASDIRDIDAKVEALTWAMGEGK